MLQFLLGFVLLYLGFYRFFTNHSKGSDLLAKTKEKTEKYKGFASLLVSKSHYIGIASVILGLIAFIAPTPSFRIDDMPVIHKVFTTQRFIGDLIPSVLAIMVGILVNPKILNVFRLLDGSQEKIENFFKKYDLILTGGAVVFGLLHWVFGCRIFL